MSNRRWAVGLTLFVSLVVYSPIVVLVLDPEGARFAAKAFGERPLGIPVRLFQFLLMTVAYLPFPYVIWHLWKVMLIYATDPYGENDPDEEDRVVGIFDACWYLIFQMQNAPEDAFHSRRVIVCGIAYYVGLIVGWIVFASIKGI